MGDLSTLLNGNVLAVILCGVVVSVAFAMLLNPVVLRLAVAKKLYDLPGGRRVHTNPTPRIGGVVFGLVVPFVTVLSISTSIKFGITDFNKLLIDEMVQLSLFFCSFELLILLGLFDDLLGINYGLKFFTQAFCAGLIIFSGLSISHLYGFFFIEGLTTPFKELVTVVFIVFCINAINLIDGIDGLAASLSLFALAFYGFMLLYMQEFIYALIAFCTFGTVSVFFFYNVRGFGAKRLKMFMGDTGSLALGFLLAIMSLKILGSSSTSSDSFGGERFIYAVAPILVPSLDVLRVFLYRIFVNRKHPFKPDNSHIHHRCLSYGLSVSKSRRIIVLSSILYAAFNIILIRFLNVNILIALDVLIWFFISYLLNLKRK